MESSFAQQQMQNHKISASSFYSEYHGHKVQHLRTLYPVLRESCDSLIWTAGDSSLDNKYWFDQQKPAVGAYGEVLSPPSSNADVTYWLNYLCQNDRRRGARQLAAINTAVEATTVNERTFRLRDQDEFIKDNIREDDILVVSIGGNDVAMAPTPCTIASVLSLMCLPKSLLENGCVAGQVPVDDCCFGCGASLLSCAGACPPCLGYMVHLFGTRVQKYIEALTSKTKPQKILVCMIYYPDEHDSPSWAGATLGALGYNSDPEKLQMMIRRTFVEATSTIHIPGSEVIPVPLFNVLDGKNATDYVARVEPSPQGGRKMADFLLDIIYGSSSYGSMTSAGIHPPNAAPYMAER